MQVATQSFPNHFDFSWQHVKNIIWRNLSEHDDYNPSVFVLLEQCRADLDRDYSELLDALDHNQELKTRYLFVQFNKTLSKYLHNNRVQLYSFLEKFYRNDDEKMVVIKTNKTALDAAVDTITKTLVNYVSDCADYDEKFRRELNAIRMILTKLNKQEKEQLYPLYPLILKPK